MEHLLRIRHDHGWKSMAMPIAGDTAMESSLMTTARRIAN
jgi:hypothetical protein